MSVKGSSEDRLWRGVWWLARPFLLAILPVPDLVSRYRVRGLAVSLITCDPWPALAATGQDAAQLALLRLRWLQDETRRAVRGRHAEAAVLLARASIETLIVGLYCRYEQDAVAELQAENIRTLPLLLKFLTDMDVIPASVLEECISRLGYGEPGRGPSVEYMAAAIDRSLGAQAAVGLYNRYYRPSSAFAAHGGGWSLLRHVRPDDRLIRRPGRTWARRSPARIADACLGALTANMARQAGRPSQVADDYTERHFGRALSPMITMSSGGIIKLLMPRQVLATAATARSIFSYARSAQDIGEPAVRVARIRAGMATLLNAAVPDLPAGTLDPFLDYVSEKIATETTPEPEDEASQATAEHS
jgi:hypothetical protein